MSKVYTLTELANTLQVHPSTVSYWVENRKIEGKTDATGKVFFTEDQVMKFLFNRQVDTSSISNSTLYIVDGADDDTFNTMVKNAYEVQKRVDPDSIHIEDINTFLVSSFDNSSEVTKKDLGGYENIVKAKIIKEVSKQINKYLYNKIHFLGELNERYDEFTLAELKSLVLCDADEDLKKKFDAITSEISHNPNDKEVSAQGSANMGYLVNSAFLSILLENRLAEIAKSVGIMDDRILMTSARQLLGYDKLVDEKTCDILADKDLKIDMNNAFVKKAIKSATLLKKKNSLTDKAKKIAEVGFYYIAKYVPNEVNSHQYIYNLLDDNTFKKVVYLGNSALAEQITFKLNSQISKGQIEFLNGIPQ